jgi:hypothetical protein
VCDTWSLNLRKKCTLVFENRVLKRIFGPKRDEVTGEWRKPHNERAPRSVLLTHYCEGDKMEKEIGGAHRAYGRGERCVQGFGRET